MKRVGVGKSEVSRNYFHVLFINLLSILCLAVLSQNIYANQIELVGEGFIPDPNQEITVQIQTDASLFCMGLGIEVSGDATITSAMCEADCNDFGWSNGWNSDPYIDPNGLVYLSGVAWSSIATGTVGYVTFQYHSGQVAVSIFYSGVYDSNFLEVPASDKILLFGQIDPNAMLIEESILTDPGETIIIGNPDPNMGSQLGDSNSITNLIDNGQTLIQQTESIEELSNPLGSRILQSKTYRITTLPLEIEGHVVIPAGTKLIAPFDPNNNIIEVMPGGLLDMGKAGVYSEPNFPDILPPVEILPEDPNQYFRHNNIGIYIRRGANPLCRIYNTVVSHCRIGIIADEGLTSPIQNVITFGCYDGIYLFAPNSIIDSEFWLYGAVGEEFYNYIGAGIYINLDGWAYPYPSAEINRTIAYSGDVGIFIEGHAIDPNLSDPNQTVPKVKVLNSILSYSYIVGFYKTTADAWIDLSYCAFYENGYDIYPPFPFVGYVQLSYDPFIIDEENKRLLIAPWSETIDAGYGMAEDGMGTCDYQPDIGPMDIGCHFPVGVRGSFGIPSSPADFNWDGIVDELDLQLMNDCMGAIADPNIVRIDTNYDSRVNLPDFGLFDVDYGYSFDPNESDNNDPNCERSDFNFDRRVDLADLEVLAQHWLTLVFDEYRICSLCNLYRNPDPNEPEIDDIIDSRDYDAFMADWHKQSAAKIKIEFCDANSFEGLDPNQPLSGNVFIQFADTPSIVDNLFLQIDNTCIDHFRKDSNQQGISLLDTATLSNGKHHIKWGYYTYQGGVWISEPNTIEVYNKISLVKEAPRYYPEKEYRFSGVYDGAGSLEITFNDPNFVYTTNAGPFAFTCSGSTDPNSPKTIQITGTESIGESSTVIYSVQKSESYDKKKHNPGSYRAVLWLPDIQPVWWFRHAIASTIAWWESKNIKYFAFYGPEANYENLRHALNVVGAQYFVAFCHGECRYPKDAEGNIIPGQPRTGFSCWIGEGVNAEPSTLYSWLERDKGEPTNYAIFEHGEAVSDYRSLRSMRLTSTPRQVWMIGCETLASDDLAKEWGFGFDNPYKVYFGNRQVVTEHWLTIWSNSWGYSSAISKLIASQVPPIGGGLGNRLITAIVNLDASEKRALFGDGHIDADMPQGWPADDNFTWYPVWNAAQLDNVPIY
jgi:hypothetical protein